MQKNTIIIIIAAVALLGIGGLYFFGGEKTAPMPQPAMETPVPVSATQKPVTKEPAASVAPVPAPTTHTITIKNMGYSQENITIKKGDTIAWINADSAPHTVTGDNGVLASDTLKTGEPYGYTFNEVGTFAYHCKFHPSMTGTVSVIE